MLSEQLCVFQFTTDLSDAVQQVAIVLHLNKSSNSQVPNPSVMNSPTQFGTLLHFMLLRKKNWKVAKEAPLFLTERLGEHGTQHRNMATATQRKRYCLGVSMLKGFSTVRSWSSKGRGTQRYQFRPAHLTLSRFQERSSRSTWSLDFLKNKPD